jgi:hypothetical protein
MAERRRARLSWEMIRFFACAYCGTMEEARTRGGRGHVSDATGEGRRRMMTRLTRDARSWHPSDDEAADEARRREPSETTEAAMDRGDEPHRRRRRRRSRGGHDRDRRARRDRRDRHRRDPRTWRDDASRVRG